MHFILFWIVFFLSQFWFLIFCTFLPSLVSGEADPFFFEPLPKKILIYSDAPSSPSSSSSTSSFSVLPTIPASSTFQPSIRHPSDRQLHIIFSKTHLADASFPAEDHYFYPMRTVDGERYMCLVPSDEASVEARLQGFHVEAKARQYKIVPPPLVAALNADLGEHCYQLHSGIFTYELCYGKHVRQFRSSSTGYTTTIMGIYGGEGASQQNRKEKAAKQSRDAESSGGSTGREDEGSMKKVNATPRPTVTEGYSSLPDRSSSRSDGGVKRGVHVESELDGEASITRFGHDHRGAYVSMMYPNGDFCDNDINGKDRRITEVRIYCSNGYSGRHSSTPTILNTEAVMDMIEVGTCKYIIALHVAEACDYSELKEPSVEREVVCYPL